MVPLLFTLSLALHDTLYSTHIRLISCPFSGLRHYVSKAFFLCLLIDFHLDGAAVELCEFFCQNAILIF
jgi:hypothetical protein